MLARDVGISYSNYENYLPHLNDIYARLEEIIDPLLEAISVVPLEPQGSAIQESVNVSAAFLKHLEINRDLLLAGPPGAGGHGIDPARAEMWVEAQASAERKRLARRLLEQVRQITHGELLKGIQVCVTKAAEVQDRTKPVVLIVGSPKKSNQQISLLFTHYWIAAGLPIDYVIKELPPLKNLQITGNIFDIDDMSYSGNQTINTLKAAERTLIPFLAKLVGESVLSGDNLKYFIRFIPRSFIEQALHRLGFRVFLIRIFASEQSIESLLDAQITLPIQMITSEVIPNLSHALGKNLIKLHYLFNFDATMAVQFDHKIADAASTFFYPLGMGVVPNVSAGAEGTMVPVWDDRQNSELTDENRAAVNEGAESVTFQLIPFLTGCEAIEGINSWNAAIESESSLEATAKRCPLSWQKQIDQNKGTFTPPTNLSGGRRKTLRKSKRKGGRKSRINRK